MALIMVFGGVLLAAWGAAKLFAELRPEPAPADPNYPGPM